MNRIKRLNEFLAAEPAVKPTIKPATPRPATPRPQRPSHPGRPSIRPGEEEQGKPMAEYMEVIDLFFDELKMIQDTPEGAKMIKKLHQKYA